MGRVYASKVYLSIEKAFPEVEGSCAETSSGPRGNTFIRYIIQIPPPNVKKKRFARKHPPALRPRGVFVGVYASALAEEIAQQLQQGSAVEIAEHNAVPPMYISLARTTSL